MIRHYKKNIMIAGLALSLAGCSGAYNSGAQDKPSYLTNPTYSAEIQKYQAEYEADSSDLSALLNLARALRYAGYPEQAMLALKDGEAAFGGHPAWLTEYGKANLASGKLAEAKTALQSATSLHDNWDAYSALGIIHDYEEDYSQALGAYTRALELCPESASIMNNMGISAAMSGNLSIARNILTKAAALRPQSRRIQKNLDLFRKIEIRCPNCSRDEIHDILKGIIVPQDWGYSDLACTTAAQEIIDVLSHSDYMDVKVLFEFDKATLTPQARETLTSMGQAFKSRELMSFDFMLEGHTDAVGTDAYNQDLSERRAAAVKNYLVNAMGISASRLSSIGYGESKLLDPSNPTNGVNRRVRIVKK